MNYLYDFSVLSDIFSNFVEDKVMIIGDRIKNFYYPMFITTFSFVYGFYLENFYNVNIMVISLCLVYQLYRFYARLHEVYNIILNLGGNEEPLVVKCEKNKLYKIIQRLTGENMQLIKEKESLYKSYIEIQGKLQEKLLDEINAKKRKRNNEIEFKPLEIDKIKHILSTDERAAKKICLINNMINNEY